MIVDFPHESKRRKWQSSNATDGVIPRPLRRWPKSGRHILAQFNDQGVIAYQAYRHAIGQFAAQHQFFSGEFKTIKYELD
jgi:hypothetical protein